MNKYKCPNCKEEQFGHEHASCCFSCKLRLLPEDRLPVSIERQAAIDAVAERDKVWTQAVLGSLPIEQTQKVLEAFGRLRPEPLASSYFCCECGYAGYSSVHVGCNYSATLLQGKPQGPQS